MLPTYSPTNLLRACLDLGKDTESDWWKTRGIEEKRRLEGLNVHIITLFTLLAQRVEIALESRRKKRGGGRGGVPLIHTPADAAATSSPNWDERRENKVTQYCLSRRRCSSSSSLPSCLSAEIGCILDSRARKKKCRIYIRIYILLSAGQKEEESTYEPDTYYYFDVDLLFWLVIRRQPRMLHEESHTNSDAFCDNSIFCQLMLRTFWYN